MHKPATKSKPAAAAAPAPRTAQPRIPVWLLAGLLVLVTMAVYWPATRCDFINFDDPEYVTANPQVQSGLNQASIKWAFANPVSGNWHPLTMLSHMLDCQWFGLNPWGPHLVNVLFHSVNAALVFALLMRLMGLRRDDPQQSVDSPSLRVGEAAGATTTATASQAGATWRSLLVAALFAVHPLHVESVAWVAERKDVLSTFFGLLTLLMYALYVEKSKVQGPKPKIFYALALFFFALGLMSKSMLVTWPFVMLLLDYWPLGRFTIDDSRFTNSRALPSRVTRHASLFLEKIPFFVLAAVAMIVTFGVQQQGGAFGLGKTLSLDARIGNALISYCRYLGKMIWPADLAVFYPHPGHWPPATVLLAGLLLVVVSGFCFVKRRQYPFLLVGWLWFCGMLVPVIGLVQVGGQAMADRYAYIPSLGLLILTVWGAYELTRRWQHHRIALSLAGSAAIVLCLALTRQQLGYWQDSETLFRHALAVTEKNYLAHNNLGDALDRKGQTDEAIRQFQEAIRLKPTYADAHFNLGNILLKKDQTDEAIRQFEENVRLKPENIDAYYKLGTLFYQEGQMDEAIRQFQEVIRLKPDYADAHYCLGIILGGKGQMNEAINQFQEVIRLKPGNAEAHNYLGIALDQKGQTDEAITQYEDYLRLKPDDAEAHHNLGNAYVRKGQMDEAIGQFQEVIRLKPDDADAHYNLGITLGAKGLVDEAIKQFQEVIRLKPDYAEAYDNLGMALVAGGRLDEAVQNYRHAIQADPKRPETLYLLGLTLGQLGRTREAVDSYRTALKLNPDLAPALNNLAWALATSPDDELRHDTEAVHLAERACELTHYAQPWFVGTLAAAYAEAGRFPEAVATAQKAEQLATSAGLTAVAAKNRQLLEFYRAGKSYRESPPAASSSPQTPANRTEQ